MMPMSPANGGVSVMPEPAQVAFRTLVFTRTDLHGSVGVPAPLYL